MTTKLGRAIGPEIGCSYLRAGKKICDPKGEVTGWRPFAGWICGVETKESMYQEVIEYASINAAKKASFRLQSRGKKVCNRSI